MLEIKKLRDLSEDAVVEYEEKEYVIFSKDETIVRLKGLNNNDVPLPFSPEIEVTLLLTAHKARMLGKHIAESAYAVYVAHAHSKGDR